MIVSSLDIAESDSLTLSDDSTDTPIWKRVDYERDVAPTRLTRYVFQSKDGAWSFVAKKRLSEQCVEFPSVSPSVSCAKVLSYFTLASPRLTI